MKIILNAFLFVIASAKPVIDWDFSVPNENFVFYNKLPRAGSQNLLRLIEKLKSSHYFASKEITSLDFAFWDDKLDSNQADKTIVDFYSNQTLHDDFNLFLTKQNYLFDWENFGLYNPTYINFMRDPIDWYVSDFTYGRKTFVSFTENGLKTHLSPRRPSSFDINDCVSRKLPDCTVKSKPYIEYFCGSTADCMTVTSSGLRLKQTQKNMALEKAKINLISDFFVVGITEKFDKSLEVFEKLLPTFFGNVTQIWQSAEFNVWRDQSTRTKVTAETRRILSEGLLKQEVDLYNFAKSLLATKYADLFKGKSFFEEDKYVAKL